MYPSLAKMNLLIHHSRMNIFFAPTCHPFQSHGVSHACAGKTNGTTQQWGGNAAGGRPPKRGRSTVSVTVTVTENSAFPAASSGIKISKKYRPAPCKSTQS